MTRTPYALVLLVPFESYASESSINTFSAPIMRKAAASCSGSDELALFPTDDVFLMT